MIALGLDLGDNTGWAYSRNDKITSGCHKLKSKSSQSDGIRYAELTNFLTRLPEKPWIIYFEEVRRHSGTIAAHVYGGYMATLLSWCHSNKVEHLGLPVGVIKKNWCGIGNADKDAMVLQAVKRGYAIKDHNQADAIAILQCGLDCFPFKLF